MVTDDEIRGNLRSVWTVEVEEVWSQKFEGIMKGDEWMIQSNHANVDCVAHAVSSLQIVGPYLVFSLLNDVWNKSGQAAWEREKEEAKEEKEEKEVKNINRSRDEGGNEEENHLDRTNTTTTSVKN